MADFIKGKDLCRRFFFEAAQPVLTREFPGLEYSAGLVGYGSDVLGYDDLTSTDHMWGPRFYLFLREEDLRLKPEILSAFANGLPYTFMGWSVNFSAPNPNDNGVRQPVFITEGAVSPLVFINTVNGFLKGYLGIDGEPSCLDWLSFSEHRLLALASGEMFVDGLNMRRKLGKLAFYPDDVRDYLLASSWSLVAEEQAFVKRCADVGDEVGSVLVCARIAERLMRLVFLYCGQYAPYSKWFGTGFRELPVDEEIKDVIAAAVTAGGGASYEDGASRGSKRERLIVKAQELVARLHNASGLTEYIDVTPQSYYGRDIQVIFADRIAEALAKRLVRTPLEGLPLIGTLSAVANFTAISDKPGLREQVKNLYITKGLNLRGD